MPLSDFFRDAFDTMPFQVYTFLTLPYADWQHCAPFFQVLEGQWKPSNLRTLANYFFLEGSNREKLCANKVKHACQAGLDIRYITCPLSWFDEERQYTVLDVSLLAMSILLCQVDCAVACLLSGVQLGSLEEPGEWEEIQSEFKKYLHGEESAWNHVASDVSLQHSIAKICAAPECLACATAAARAALQASRQRESKEKGVAVFQFLRCWDRVQFVFGWR